jgi:hypothetical protein
MIACKTQTKVDVNHMMCLVTVELPGFVIAQQARSAKYYAPSLTPRIGNA